MEFKKLMMISVCSVSLLGNVFANAEKVFSSADKLPGSLQWQHGKLINNSTRQQKISAAAKMAENTRLTIPVKLPAKGTVQLQTTRGTERFTIHRRDDYLVWAFYDLNDKMVKPADHWWENNNYYPNGFFQDNFALSRELRNRINSIKSKFYRDINQTFFPLTIENRQGKLRLFFDHILIAEMPATADLAKKSPVMILPPGTEIGAGVVEKLPELAENFYAVDLSAKFNAANLCSDLKDGKKSLTYKGIPFELSLETEQGFAALDLGQVWFAEGTLSAYAPPNSGTFGGRWGGALGGNRSRMQFRIPNRQYTAIYLLASCEERADRIAEVSAQFFRNRSGFPKNFTAEKVEISGRDLQLIKIPVEPGELTEFRDRNTLELELTGRTHIFRAWPDPNHFSIHGAGTPSGVQVYAMTLETAPVTVEFTAESEGNVWVESTPAYTVTLTNNTAKKMVLPLEIVTESFDGKEVVKDFQDLTVMPGGKAVTRFDLPLKKYGWHRVTLACNGKNYTHYLTRLRRREIKGRSFDVKGFMFGYWDWDGAHLTADNALLHRLFGMAGLESFARGNGNILDRSCFKTAVKWGFKYFSSHYRGVEREPESFEAMQKYLKEREVHRATHRISSQSPANFFEPVYTHVFAEPGGIGTHGVLPEFYGEPVKKLTPDEEKVFLAFKKKVMDAHKIFRTEYPHTKILLPWGDPVFTVPFLQDEETRNCFDGVAYDTGYFMRLPEQQLHQCSIHRMMQFRYYWNKFRKDKPVLVSVEGPCIARVAPGSLDQRSNAAHTIRCALLLAAYGINRQFAIAGTTSCASYWGEQHYGGGAFTRVFDINPYAVYAAIGTLARHLRYMEFVRWVPVGSLSVYALEFKDSRNGKLLHVLWTVRGKRPVKMKYSQIYDLMDNLTTEAVISDLPVFVYGSDGKFELGEPDHSDAVLGKNNIRLGSTAELFPVQCQDADDEYVNSFPDAVRRFPAVMELKKVSGGLSVHLPEQKVERLTMPYYTALKPAKPILIPGKAKYITMEVTADSDWGRIVYSLRDAKGEKFISVGQKNSWNSDDQLNASYFNFDGKRLVRFELPASLTYDGFREAGSTWWGVSGGDGVVDYPLTIEKIFVERRRHAMYVNTLEPTTRKAVILGDLFAEYDSEEMKKFVPQVKMPPVKSAGKEFNLIRELDKTGVLPAAEITAVEQPDHYYDGTRGIFHFKEVKGAAYYDIYLSLNSDGSQAIKRGSNLKKSGVLVNGFLADTDFYAFVVYYTRDGRQSKVSAPFKFRLKDNFSNK